MIIEVTKLHAKSSGNFKTDTSDYGPISSSNEKSVRFEGDSKSIFKSLMAKKNKSTINVRTHTCINDVVNNQK